MPPLTAPGARHPLELAASYDPRVVALLSELATEPRPGQIAGEAAHNRDRIRVHVVVWH